MICFHIKRHGSTDDEVYDDIISLEVQRVKLRVTGATVCDIICFRKLSDNKLLQDRNLKSAR
jgi:hypothetical protein